MNKSRLLSTAALAAIVLALPAIAQESASDTESLESLTVWGTRVRASSVNLDERAMALRQADHISDLLRPVPGVDVGGAHSLNQRITIRSMDDKDLRISIDGANQNTYMFHHMGNLQIHADILQSVDIDVGRNSVLTGGLGGAVRFETRQARDLLREGQRFGARAQVSHAENAQDSWSAAAYGQLTDSLDVLAYYNDVRRDNYEVGGGKILDQDGNVIPGTDGKVRGLEGQVRDALLKFGWNFAPGQRLRLGYETYEDEGDYSQRPDMGLATGLTIANNLQIPLLWPTKFTRDTLTLNYDLEQEGFTLKTSLFRNDSTFWRDERGYIDLWPEDAVIREGQADNLGFSALATHGFGRHDLAYGVDYIDYETAYVVAGEQLAGEDATNFAIFVQDAISLGDRFTLTPGVRYERFDLDATFVDDDFDEITGALALRFDATDDLAFRLSGTQLFKAPELSEVFIGAGLYDDPSPGIRAETGYNAEFAVNHRVDVGGGRLSTGVTLFRTRIDDYIYDYAETDTFYGKDNVGDMRIEGYEAFIGYDVGNLRTLLTVSDAESGLDAFPEYAVFQDARIDRQQGDTLSIELDYEWPARGLVVHWDTLLVDEVAAGPDLDGASLDNAKDGFIVHNLSAQWSPSAWRGWSITLGIDNVFDEFYASQSSRTGVSRHPRFGQLYLQDYEPGRNIKGTITWRF